MSRLIKDEKIRQGLSFHSLMVGGNPYQTSSIHTLIHYLERKWGVFFLLGGTGALVGALLRLFEELGGTVHLSAPVERIDVGANSGGPDARHHVCAQGLPVEIYHLVVSNADIHHTHSKLYRSAPAARPMARKLEWLDWSMSLFVLDRIRNELDRIHAGAPQLDITLATSQEVVRECRIPREYPDELLAGMEMGVRRPRPRRLALALRLRRARRSHGVLRHRYPDRPGRP